MSPFAFLGRFSYSAGGSGGMRILNDSVLSTANVIRMSAVHAAIASSSTDSVDAHSQGVFSCCTTQHQRPGAAASLPSREAWSECGYDPSACQEMLAGQEGRRDRAANTLERCASTHWKGVTALAPRPFIANPDPPESWPEQVIVIEENTEQEAKHA